MTQHRRKDDKMIDEIQADVKAILKILNPSNGNLGLVAQVHVNKDDICEIKNKPSTVKGWVVAAAVVINTLVAGIALWKVL